MASMESASSAKRFRLGHTARRTLGICLLLVVVILWTASNFLASTIFADNTYSKPFFVTYLNTSTFILPLFTIVASRLWALSRAGKLYQVQSFGSLIHLLDSHQEGRRGSERQRILGRDREDGVRDGAENEGVRTWEDDDRLEDTNKGHGDGDGKLGLRETARLSFHFCLLWFTANYFSMACLQYTTVGSTTILTSTSGVWTLIFGALFRIEKFTFRKAAGVIASLFGIILISRVDLSSTNDPSSGASGSHFPQKSPAEIALGDSMAAFSAIMYGVYTIVLKRQVGDESRVNMQLFFGLVGVFNALFLWPGFLILHITEIEPFSLPDSSRVWGIILINSLSSLLSDIAWAYAMLLTSPLVVTVGLSLTIPLSLVGQIFLLGEYAAPLYWVGATVVFVSFAVVNHENEGSGEEQGAGTGRYEVLPGGGEG
ncbi:DMT family transporter [Aspergillus stella-maris]|uniref:DMT family transporter n=1 Tax=Aspergillus stella-maris TaxID=1810926 RepID=UPI003CCD5DE6